MAAKSAKGRSQTHEVPPAVIVVCIVLAVIALGAGGFYAYNGGWKTAAQQEEQYKHEMLPIMEAKHGDMEALNAENKLRQSRGQAPLEVPRNKEKMAGSKAEKLAELQRKMGAGQGGGQ